MRKGRPSLPIEKRLEIMTQQLLSNYIVDEKGCWIWQGPFWTNGCGRMSRSIPTPIEAHQRSHIFPYMYHIGPIKNNLFVCHKCDEVRCINPNYLFLGTNQENQLDAVKKFPEKYPGRQDDMSGSNNPMFGRKGELAPCFGRTGPRHPMYGKHHTKESREKTSQSLKRTFAMREGKVGSKRSRREI